MSSSLATRAAVPSRINHSTGTIASRRQRKSCVARLIPREVWRLYEKKIEELYVTGEKTLTLDKLRERMYQDHGFEASPKQWKAYLRKQNLTKYLTFTNAGLALRLYHEARSGHFVRRVKIWTKYRSLASIREYIRKSPRVRSEAELLNEVSQPVRYPRYITCEDSPSAESHPPETPPPDEPGQMERDSSNHVPDSLSSSSSIEYVTLEEETANVPINDSTGLSDSDDPILIDHRDAPETDGIRGARDLGIAAALSATGSSVFDAVVDSFAPGFEFGLEGYDFSFCNSQLSITPIADYPANDFVSKALGSNQEVKDACSTGCIKAFLQHCCEAMFYYNRQDDKNSQFANQSLDLAINAAVQSYNHVVLWHFEWSLTTLNNMLFLLELYGQRLLAWQILTGIHAGLMVLGGPAFATARTIAQTVAFKIDILCPKETPNFDLEILGGICDELAQKTIPESPLVLTAQYNLAWASLEMAISTKIPQSSQDPVLEETRRIREQERDQALQKPRFILESIRSACERIFGPFQIQTITCMATLARVYLTMKECTMAELLIDDVAKRVEQSFSRTHPLYWELKNRQALFTLSIAKSNVRPDRTNEYWHRGENLLRDVLVWRASDSGLGKSNPQTARTMEVLKHWLKQQSKLTEAENVSGWLDEKLNASE